MVRKVNEHGVFRRKVDLFGVSVSVLALVSDYDVSISFCSYYEFLEGAACEVDRFKSGWYIPLRCN